MNARLKDVLLCESPVYSGRWGLFATSAYVLGVFLVGIVISVGLAALGAAAYALLFAA
jgi:hypothetical protein